MENIIDIRTFLDNPTNNLSLWLNGFEKFRHFHQFISADGKLHVSLDYFFLDKIINVKVYHIGENLDGKIETYKFEIFAVHYSNKKEVKSLISFIDEKWLTKSVY